MSLGGRTARSGVDTPLPHTQQVQKPIPIPAQVLHTCDNALAFIISIPQDLVVMGQEDTTCSTMVRLVISAKLCYNAVNRTYVLSFWRKRSGDDGHTGGIGCGLDPISATPLLRAARALSAWQVLCQS